ncbi:uncharacterized protein LOC113343116 [Papaver somniferum]|uniref:uncharacterized protein LOC113343116 n=1 Tax=Papaver somniferum TaxID=3469 RepID=UPI000E6FBCC0|nr:uncharacterized protein LOC113343116 [Papaver somniferum]
MISSGIHHMDDTVSNPLYKSLWKLPVIPKVQLFIWKCHENILPNKYDLATYNDSDEPTCIMYNSDLIERDTNYAISIQQWVTKWIYDINLKEKAGVVFSIAWSIWKDRCSCIFQGKHLNCHDSARLALKLINDTELFLCNDVAHYDTPPDPVEEKSTDTVINSLHEDCLIILSDFAFEKDSNSSGTCEMNNLAGTFVGCKLKAGTVRNAEEAECLALLEEVKWAKGKGLEKVCFISDAKTVIDHLDLISNQLYWYNKSVLDVCKTVISSFQFVNFEFLRRNHIVLADQEAKLSRRSRTYGQWLGNVPYFLNPSM